MRGEGPVAVVAAWQDAVNRQDVERLVALSSPDIELGGPRGSGRGSGLLRLWFRRAGLRLRTRRVFARGEVVVVAQRGVWRDGETGEVVGEADFASCFRVAGERVARFARYDSLDAALAAAGLTQADETPVH
jgi:hypothetical protein